MEKLSRKTLLKYGMSSYMERMSVKPFEAWGDTEWVLFRLEFPEGGR
jgi:hypothetical protein